MHYFVVGVFLDGAGDTPPFLLTCGCVPGGC